MFQPSVVLLRDWWSEARSTHCLCPSFAMRVAILRSHAAQIRIESTFDVGRRFRCTMRVDCGRLDPGTVIRPDPGEWLPRMPERLDEEELADWRAGRDAVYQLAALTIGARFAVADG